MAKDLPYFKFHPSEWVTGEITLCSIEAQGLFINLCSYYWVKSCSMSLAIAKQRFSKNEAALKQLLSLDIFAVDDDDNIIIDFLDDQMGEFVDLAEKRASAGRKGGKAKAKQVLSKAKAKPSKERRGEKRREEERREENNIHDFEIEEIYLKYPTRCIVSQRPTSKTKKDKDKIKKLLKGNPKSDILEIIDLYVSECRTNETYMKNFGTFLNNFPEKDSFKQLSILDRFPREKSIYD